MVDPYKILGISENAEAEEVKAAFQEKKKELQKQLLSKKPEEQKAASNQLQELVAAYGAIKKQMETNIGSSSSSSLSKEPQKRIPVMGMEVEKKSSTEPSPLLPSYQLDENETEESSWQTMMKNGQAGEIAIAVLGALVIGLGGYIAYDHFSKPTMPVPAPNTINDINGKAPKEALDITNKIKEELSHKPQVELRPKAKETEAVTEEVADESSESDTASSEETTSTRSVSNRTSAQDVFKKFHRAITRKQYRDAYNFYSSDMQNAVGSYESWARGYMTTVSSMPEQVSVIEQTDDMTKLSFILKAVDKKNGKMITRRFKGIVTLVQSDDGWKIDEIRGDWL